MPEDSRALDADIIRAAYAEKVKETFKVFAENLGTGQNEQNSRERFLRSLDLLRKARDVALDMLDGAPIIEPVAPGAAESEAAGAAVDVDGLSAEDQALIEHALAGTTGHKRMLRR